MTERWERCWNAKMQRFSFDGRSCGMTVERRVFLVPPSFLTERGRPNEDGMKKVGWLSYGGTLTNLIDLLKKSLFQTISWGGSRYLKVVNPLVWHQSW